MEKLKYILDIQTFAEDPEQEGQEGQEEQEEQEEQEDQDSHNRLLAKIDILSEELEKVKKERENLDKRNRELEKTNIKLTQQGKRGSDPDGNDEDPFFTTLKNFLK